MSNIWDYNSKTTYFLPIGIAPECSSRSCNRRIEADGVPVENGVVAGLAIADGWHNHNNRMEEKRLEMEDMGREQGSTLHSEAGNTITTTK